MANGQLYLAGSYEPTTDHLSFEQGVLQQYYAVL